jgi:dTDP-glucose 4,6-dehydratase
MSKAAAEMLVASYWASHRLPILITRGVSTFGPGQPPDPLVHEFITRALAGVALPDGRAYSTPHDYLYVEDHAAAIGQVLLNGVPGETYDVGTGLEVTGFQVANLVLRLCGRGPAENQLVIGRPAHDRKVALGCRPLRLLGWMPRHDLESGLRLTIDWYRLQEARLRRPPAFASTI